MKVGGISLEIDWENPNRNLKNIIKHIRDNESKLDVIVFPEASLTGFLNVDNSEDVMEYLLEIQNSIKTDVKIFLGCYKKGFNSVQLITKKSISEIYKKIHLFKYAGEDGKSGSTRNYINIGGFVFFPTICFDLRFPDLYFNNDNVDIDLIIVQANWPKARISEWEAMLRSRAIENECYILGVNCIGRDLSGNIYEESTMFFDKFGIKVGHYHEGLNHLDLHISHRDLIRNFKKEKKVITKNKITHVK